MRRPANTDPPPLALVPLPARQHRRLAAPAEPEDAPAADAREAPPRRRARAQQLGLGAAVVAVRVEPAPDPRLLLGRVGRQPGEVRVRALEQVRQDHDGVVAQQRGQPVRALQRLRREAEGVVEEDEAALGGRAGGGGLGDVWVVV